MKFLKTRSFELAAYVKGDESSKLALVLPGRLDTKDYPHMRSHVDYLASRGYFAVSFDPPGTWDSKGDISIYTMTNYLKAINELIEFFGNRPTVLMGHSLGGTVAMLVGSRNDRVTHIITVMSHASAGRINVKRVDGDVQISRRDIPLTEPVSIREFRLPLNFFDDSKKYHSVDEFKNCPKPKLLFFGAKDALVKPEEVRKIFDIAVEPKRIHELDSPHDYRRHPEIIEEVNRIVGEWL